MVDVDSDAADEEIFVNVSFEEVLYGFTNATSGISVLFEIKGAVGVFRNFTTVKIVGGFAGVAIFETFLVVANREDDLIGEELEF